MIGGVTVDMDGRTTLPGLWAAGEVTSSGLHGANRLASNSLLEGLFFGQRCGRGASEAAKSIPDNYSAVPLRSGWESETSTDDGLNLVDLRNSLTSLMVRNVGIRRNAEELQQAAQQVEFWERYVGARELQAVAGWELQNMLLVARLMIASALARTESRGVHFRIDFPKTNPGTGEHVSIIADEDAERPASAG
jgi:L-aspartate oxidase